jgi:signal transduction histidine kinase
VELAGFHRTNGGAAEGAGLAHDASNLLGALSLYSELLAAPGVLHEEHREFAQELRLLSERSWAMIDRLVNYARIETRTAKLAERTILPEVVERCRGVLSRVAGRSVEVSYGQGAYERVCVRTEAVERILTNLVKNASEAMTGAGNITVRIEGALGGTAHCARSVTMTVQDTGCGMSSAAVRRLMRAGGISPAEGRGLGFRVVRELVAISGGHLNVKSRPGTGTSVAVKWECSDEMG